MTSQFSTSLAYPVVLFLSVFYPSLINADRPRLTSPSSYFRLPLIRRSLNHVDSYSLPLLIGSPPQKVLLQLDTQNEGLRLFAPSSQLPDFSLSSGIPNDSPSSRIPDSSPSSGIPKHSVKLTSVGLTSTDFAVSESDAYQIRQLSDAEDEAPNESNSTYKPELSESLRFCLSKERCLPSWSGDGTFACTATSEDPMDAQFYNYSDFRSPSNLQPATICEERAEASEIVEFVPDSADADGGLIKLRLADAPVKLVRRRFDCSDPAGGKTDLADSDKSSSSVGEVVLNSVVKSNLADNYSMELNQAMRKSQAQTSSKRNRLLEVDESIDGVLGLAGPACRKNTFLNLTLSESGTSVVGLDFTAPDSPFISLSSKITNSAVHWSEQNQNSRSEVQFGNFFTSYDWKMCNVDLGYNESSHWGTQINLNSPCLGLPVPLWDAVMKWIPVTCPEKSNKCRLSDGYEGENLPALSFALHSEALRSSLPRQSDSRHLPSSRWSGSADNNFRIQIPLDSLIINSGSAQELCVERLTSDSNDEDVAQSIVSSISPSIQIGTMLLRYIVVFMDHEMGRVGLRPKWDPILGSSDKTCLAESQCKGQQVYYPPKNYCMNPICGAWFFKSFNEETGNCEYASWALLTLCIVVPVFIAADLFTNIFYWKTVSFAKQRSR